MRIADATRLADAARRLADATRLADAARHVAQAGRTSHAADAQSTFRRARDSLLERSPNPRFEALYRHAEKPPPLSRSCRSLLTTRVHHEYGCGDAPF